MRAAGASPRDSSWDWEVRRARNAAYLLLSFRARSGAEIEKRLVQKGFPIALVKEITDELAAAGLLDDPAFAEAWIRNRRETRPKGKALLRWELRRKGVPSETVESALDSIEPEDELESARALASRQWERMKDPDPAARIRRIAALLQRRGYSWDTIREATASLEELSRGDEPWEES